MVTNSVIMSYQSIDHFDTKRIIAQRHTAGDFDTVLATYQDELTMQSLGGMATMEDAAKRIEWNLKCWEKDGFGCWLWFHKESGRFIGRGGLRKIELEEKSVIEVGYVLLSEFWGQGFATEIATASIEVAFGHLGIKELASYTTLTNKASQHVMVKAGFKFEHNFIHCGEPHVLYRLTLRDYLQSKDQPQGRSNNE